MKKFQNFMLLLAVTLIIGAVLVGSCSAQAPTNYLKIKGHILNDYTAEMTIYCQDEATSNWNTVIQKNVKNNYRIRLATDKNYQLIFMSDVGHTKVVHIKKGDPGMYIEYIDIDFEGSPERHKFQTKIEFYSNRNEE